MVVTSRSTEPGSLVTFQIPCSRRTNPRMKALAPKRVLISTMGRTTAAAAASGAAATAAAAALAAAIPISCQTRKRPRRRYTRFVLPRNATMKPRTECPTKNFRTKRNWKRRRKVYAGRREETIHPRSTTARRNGLVESVGAGNINIRGGREKVTPALTMPGLTGGSRVSGF